ncbi:hypothetical protein QOK74_08355 [Staphylococcus saprophyticus]|uniref:hypothetical protein n=1 Tax=Staphylococcus saprophyticus TaxID=29385 RepID=UPI0024C2EC99|nr:hypothetical protein [Staphylococcus saprophyticus]MDK1672883.1 hypothetical protein [Staphylococcus saprophyticus]
MTKLDLHTFEVITAITTTYQNEIETYLLNEYDEIMQWEFADLVMSLYNAYMDDKTPQSLLSLIQIKHIELDEIIYSC